MSIRIERNKFMRYSLLLTIGLLFTKCGSDKEAHLYFNEGRVIVDSTTQGKEFLSFDPDDSGAYYPVYYLGKPTDTVFLGRRPISMFSNEELENRYDSAKNWNSTADMKINILVDTAMNVGHEIIYSHFSDNGEREIIDSAKSMKAFTIFITNMSDSLVLIGSHNFVGYLTREVQDKDGNWIEIEHRLTDLCGTAKRSLVLEPNDIIVAKLLRYQGDTMFLFRLKLSIKFGNVEAYRTYSNEYSDYFDMDLTAPR
jgi:hypothetical protein